MFETVFEISRNSNGVFAGLLVDLAIGLGALATGLAVVVALVRRRVHGVGEWLFALVVIGWGAFWIAMTDFPVRFGEIQRLTDDPCTTVEGDVRVLFHQPAHGHTDGDRIEIGGMPFTVNYYLATPAYRNTIAHGGALTPGARVRVCHVDGEIVRVEVRRDPSDAREL